MSGPRPIDPEEERRFGDRFRAAADRIVVPVQPLGRRTRRVRAHRAEPDVPLLGLLRERLADRPTRAIAGIVMLAILVTTTLGVITPSRAIASSSILTIISGEVLVQPTPDAVFRPGADGETLKAGMTVESKDDARAVLTFEDGSTMELEPGAKVAIDEVATGSSGELLVRLQQTIGQTWSHVQPLLSPNSRFHIKTPSATAVVRGTSFQITVQIQGPGGQVVTTVNVFQGQVDMVAAGVVQPVPAGRTTNVQTGSPPQPTQQIVPPPQRLRLGLTGPAAQMTATDPDGRTAGQTSFGTVSQIPPACTIIPPAIRPFRPSRSESGPVTTCRIPQTAGYTALTTPIRWTPNP